MIGAVSLALLGLTACQREEGADPPRPAAGIAPGDLQLHEAREREEFHNSGRTLSGVYELIGPVGPLTSARYTFTEEGAFTRSLALAGGARREESGSYVIDSDGRLVLYVERTDGTLQPTAAREIFTLAADGAEGLALVDASGRRELYARSGEPPPLGAGRPTVQ